MNLYRPPLKKQNKVQQVHPAHPKVLHQSYYEVLIACTSQVSSSVWISSHNYTVASILPKCFIVWQVALPEEIAATTQCNFQTEK